MHWPKRLILISPNATGVGIAVRSGMSEHNLDLLIVLPEFSPIDARYLARENGAVLFPLDGDPWILLGGEDSDLAVDRAGWIGQRESATPLGSTKVPYGYAVAEKLKTLKLGAVRIGIVGLNGNSYAHVRSAEGYVPYSTVKHILDVVGEVEVVDGSTIMAQARYVKSKSDLSLIRSQVKFAEAGAMAIGEAFHKGATQADAYRSGITAMLQPGLGLPAVAWCPGIWGNPRPRIVGVPSGQITDGLCVAAEIMPGSPVFVQVAEPYIAGSISSEQKEAFEINIAAFEAARSALVPGATWREVETAVLAVADGTGWDVSFLLHGGPDGPLFIPTDTHEAVLDDRIEQNTVFICKPTVYPLAEGRVIARSYDVTWGDMIVVGEGGAERLGTRAQKLVSYE